MKRLAALIFSSAILFAAPAHAGMSDGNGLNVQLEGASIDCNTPYGYIYNGHFLFVNDRLALFCGWGTTYYIWR